MFKQTLCGLLAAFSLASCGATLDRHDAAAGKQDLQRIKAESRRQEAEFQTLLAKTEAERERRETAQQAAMEERRQRGDYGEVYELENGRRW